MASKRHEHLARNNSVMHKIDNIQDFQKDTVDIYKPKKSTEITPDNLFDDGFNDAESSKTDEDNIDASFIIGIIVVVVIAVGIIFALKHFGVF